MGRAISIMSLCDSRRRRAVAAVHGCPWTILAGGCLRSTIGNTAGGWIPFSRFPLKNWSRIRSFRRNTIHLYGRDKHCCVGN